MQQPAASALVPLFPLSNVWLFPGVIMPLHIFEPRYRQMIEDSLDCRGWLVIGTVLEGHEHKLCGQQAPVYPIAGLGEIGWHERLPDGRFLIRLVGLARVRLSEQQSERMYRRVEVEPVPEPDPPEAATLREQLTQAIAARTPEPPKFPDNMPIARMADFLTLRLPLPHKNLQALFAECNPGERARRALAEHAYRPV